MIDYFIITHNPNIELSQLRNNLPYSETLCVGEEKFNRGIICNKLEYNLEQYPKLCSFTAWYAAAKNKLSSEKFISLLEYDITISNKFHEANLYVINNIYNNSLVIAYNKTLTNHYVFYKSTPWLEICLQKIYNINLYDFINEIMNTHPYWPTSTNITLSRNVLNSFVDWFTPMTKYFRNDPLGSYVQERAFFIFCVINKIEIHYIYNVLNHYQLQSHKNNDLYGEFLQSKKTKIFTDSMVSEYNKIYQEQMKKCELTCGD